MELVMLLAQRNSLRTSRIAHGIFPIKNLSIGMVIIFPIGLAKLVMLKFSEIFLKKISFGLEMYDHRPKIEICVVLSQFWILDII